MKNQQYLAILTIHPPSPLSIALPLKTSTSTASTSFTLYKHKPNNGAVKYVYIFLPLFCSNIWYLLESWVRDGDMLGVADCWDFVREHRAYTLLDAHIWIGRKPSFAAPNAAAAECGALHSLHSYIIRLYKNIYSFGSHICCKIYIYIKRVLYICDSVTVL